MHSRENFTAYEVMPEDLAIYLSHNGPHFNRNLYEFAVSKMTKIDASGEEVPIKPFTKEEVEKILKAHNVKLKNNQLYDFVYVASMCKADFLSSSVPDEHYLALYVKDVIDDIDAPDGLVFNRWYADMSYMGIAIDWEEML